MIRSGFKPRTTPMKSAAISRAERKEAGAVSKLKAGREAKSKPMKSRGMKGRQPTPAEQVFMDKVAKIGCLPCRKDGRENLHVSIHHIDGRTKEGAHFKVLALCGPHHQQDDSDPLHRISVHGAKKPFEAEYGTQYELLAESIEIINSGTAPSYEQGAVPEHLSLEQ